MDKKSAEAFYVGAALFLDLDSDEVDVVLADHGLSVEANSVEDCRACILNYKPLILTAPEAAQMYGIPQRTITYAARNSHIATSRQERGTWTFERSAFEHWLANRPRPGPKRNQDGA